jgi:hypothetical protein
MLLLLDEHSPFKFACTKLMVGACWVRVGAESGSKKIMWTDYELFLSCDFVPVYES